MIRVARAGLRSPRMQHVPVIGRRDDGSPIYGIAGGAGDDEEDDDGEEEEDDEDDEDEEDDSKSKSGGKSSEEDDDDEDDDEKPVTREEFESMQRRMRAADRHAHRAEAELRRLKKQGQGGKGKDKDDKKDDVVVQELRTKAQRAEELESDNVALSVQIAVLTTPEASQFHDPEDILRFLDFDELVDGEGSIDKAAVKDALHDLAENKKHLVKTSSSAAGDDEEDEEGKKKLPKSGRQNNGKKSKGKTLTRAALAAKYPALRDR